MFKNTLFERRKKNESFAKRKISCDKITQINGFSYLVIIFFLFSLH